MTTAFKKTGSVLFAGLMVAGVGATAAHAATVTTSSNVSDSVSTDGGSGGNGQSPLQIALKSGNVDQIISVAESMIDARVQDLNDLKTTIGGFTRVSATDKATLTTEVQTNIDSLTALRTKIAGDRNVASSTLKQDATSITHDYRIGILVNPQVKKVLVADRIETINASFTSIAAKLEARIKADQTISAHAGNDSAAEAALKDMEDNNIAANNKALKAEAELVALKPDNGDQTVLAANNAAIQDARGVLQNAHDEIAAARKDLDQVLSLLGISKTKSS